VTSANFTPLAFWDAITTAFAADNFGTLADGKAYAPIGVRIPRHITTATITGARLKFTTASSAAAEFETQVVLGMFPITLGQDLAI